ncbi:MAG: ABC-F type ribosomal protection protein [Bacillus sp. (in: Bacteria)]|nr:ABC-F type ribosomal protection protein [Bacillus sp. (in: firmicutes)]
MRELLKLANLSYEMIDLMIFENINATAQQGDRIGIIGKNGAGKTTLLQLIEGKLQPSTGQINWLEPNLQLTIVEQETEEYSFLNPTPQEKKLLEKWNVPSHWDFAQLSGGEKLKARLAKGFSQRADVLFLDEPTNHLDQQSMELLRQQFQEYRGMIIFVSHDRHFMDQVATKIWSLEGRQLVEHKGNYSSYMSFRQEKRRLQQREYEKQQRMVERIEGQIKELKSWSEKAHRTSTKKEGMKEYWRKKAKRTDAQVKSKQKRLEKELERVKAKPVTAEYSVEFDMKANAKKGKRFLEVKDLSVSVGGISVDGDSFDGGGRTLFAQANFTIQHGEKVAVVGPNGSGKTTLLRVILADLPTPFRYEGEVWVSPSAEIGYLTQEVFDLPLEATPAELFHQETFAARGKVQNLMKHLGFAAAQWTEPVGEMSMGERVKMKLMKYILEEKDVLVLDEPTNHLDLPSREQLEETLAEYKGTLVVVSHDQYFLVKTTKVKLVIGDGRIEKQLSGATTAEPRVLSLSSSKQGQADQEELRLRLETERQEVLGKLSFMTAADDRYGELDQRFQELTKAIKSLKTARP